MTNRTAVLASCLFGGCLALVTGLDPAEAAGRSDYCAKSGQTIVFLIDQTSQFDGTDVRNLKDGIQTVYAHLGVGDRLIMGTITDSYADSTRLFDACKPGCLLEEGSLSCSKTLAKRDLQDFAAKLRTVVASVIKDPARYPRSDILGTIVLAGSNYGPDELIAYTDGLQNTRELRLPSTPPQKAEAYCDGLAASFGQEILAGIRVTLFGGGRDHTQDRRPLPLSDWLKIRAFWQKCMSSFGASQVTVVTQLSDQMQKLTRRQ